MTLLTRRDIQIHKLIKFCIFEQAVGSEADPSKEPLDDLLDFSHLEFFKKFIPFESIKELFRRKKKSFPCNLDMG